MVNTELLKIRKRPTEQLFDKHKKEILKLYFKKNFTYAMILDKFGISQSSCCRFFKLQGIKSRQSGWKLQRGSPTQDFLNKKKNKIIKLYFKKRYSSAMLAEKFHTSQTAVMRFFKTHKIKMRKEGWDAPDNSKYTYNDNFFNTPNILNCYWAGFISADGCIYDRKKRGKSLVITIAQKDEIILKRFKRDIKYNGEIKKYEYTTNYGYSKSCRLSIHNKKIVDDLEKNWNIIPRKTFKLKPALQIKNFKLFFSFLMGYIDGDGSFTYSIQKNGNWKNKYVKLLINGNRAVLDWFKKILSNFFGDEFGKIYPSKSIYFLSIHKRRHLELMYKQSEKMPISRLDRKWKILKKFVK